MKGLKLLVLTNHKTHTSRNSIYALLTALARHDASSQIDVASAGLSANKLFFDFHLESRLMAAPVLPSFEFSIEGEYYLQQSRWVEIMEYDLILLRMPPPADQLFFDFLTTVFPAERIINNPHGILETGSKQYLLQHQELCPPMKYCQTVAEVEQFAAHFPIVLKPLNNYGGKGIIKLNGKKIWKGNELITFDEFAQEFEQAGRPVLAMKYLKKVNRGDKRIIVCNDTVIGASLRKPAKGNWLCNGAQGGQSGRTRITREERLIADQLSKALLKKGVFMFGFDTLVDDNGKRILSEINTNSIGGLKQISEQSGPHIMPKVAKLFWAHAKKIINATAMVSRH